jgi:hypothetical protein
MNQSHYIDIIRQTNHDRPGEGGGYIPVGLVVSGPNLVEHAFGYRQTERETLTSPWCDPKTFPINLAYTTTK